MRNALAIAQKEIASYFASPIAYVLIGFFALLFGLPLLAAVTQSHAVAVIDSSSPPVIPPEVLRKTPVSPPAAARGNSALKQPCW